MLHLNQGKLQQTYLVTSSNEAWWVIFPFLYSTRQITLQFYKQISQLYFNKRNILIQFFFLYKNQRSAPLLLFAIIIPWQLTCRWGSSESSAFWILSGDMWCPVSPLPGISSAAIWKRTLEGYKCASWEDTIDRDRHAHTVILFSSLCPFIFYIKAQNIN